MSIEPSSASKSVPSPITEASENDAKQNVEFDAEKRGAYPRDKAKFDDDEHLAHTSGVKPAFIAKACLESLLPRPLQLTAKPPHILGSRVEQCDC